MNRVKAGFVLTENPFNGKLYAVSLRPEDVACFVFWSKNYEPFLPFLPALKDMGYGFCFHYTITGLPPLFEPSVLPAERMLQSFAAINSLRQHIRSPFGLPLVELAFYLLCAEQVQVR